MRGKSCSALWVTLACVDDDSSIFIFRCAVSLRAERHFRIMINLLSCPHLYQLLWCVSSGKDDYLVMVKQKNKQKNSYLIFFYVCHAQFEWPQLCRSSAVMNMHVYSGFLFFRHWQGRWGGHGWYLYMFISLCPSSWCLCASVSQLSPVSNTVCLIMITRKIFPPNVSLFVFLMLFILSRSFHSIHNRFCSMTWILL